MDTCDDDNVFKENFRIFLLENYRRELEKILAEASELKHYPLEIFFFQLPTRVSERLVKDADVLSLLDQAARNALDILTGWLGGKPQFISKRHIHIRILSLPNMECFIRSRIPGLNDIGKFFAITGTIGRIYQPKLLEFNRLYRCMLCGDITVEEARCSRSYAFVVPEKCKMCYSKKFEQVIDNEPMNDNTSYAMMRDYQETVLQDISYECSTGRRELPIILLDDLVNSVRPAETVTITGKLELQCKKFKKGEKLSSRLVFIANHVECGDNRIGTVQISRTMLEFFEEFWQERTENLFYCRDLIVNSICPEIHGLYMVKLALAVSLCCNTSDTFDHVDKRQAIHLLLIGDPGVAKSRILKFVNRLVGDSVYANGHSTTFAGLIASVYRDDIGYNLQAGLVALSDKSFCLIDEFSLLGKKEMDSMLEVMEQGSLTISKAGINCTIRSRCSVIAACNPREVFYNPQLTVDMNVQFSPSLLSRFDIIAVLRDLHDPIADRKLAEFILLDPDVKQKNRQASIRAGTVWTEVTLRNYLAVVKGRSPTMSSDAKEIIGRYFYSERTSRRLGIARTTPRLLNSLLRLSESHARLMMSKEVTVLDAIVAIQLSELFLNSESTVTTNAPSDPLKCYYENARAILTSLDLPKIWQKEKQYLDILIKRREFRPEMGPPLSPPPSATDNFTGMSSSPFSHTYN